MNNNLDIVLLERETSMSTKDLIDLAHFVHENIRCTIIPLDICAHNVESCAIGFISEAAALHLGYEFEPLESFVINILDDMDNESEDGRYVFECNGYTFNILLTRNL